jgi:hypothetical protein
VPRSCVSQLFPFLALVPCYCIGSSSFLWSRSPLPARLSQAPMAPFFPELPHVAPLARISSLRSPWLPAAARPSSDPLRAHRTASLDRPSFHGCSRIPSVGRVDLLAAGGSGPGCRRALPCKLPRPGGWCSLTSSRPSPGARAGHRPCHGASLPPAALSSSTPTIAAPLSSPARFSARRRALPAASLGLRLCRADLRSSVAVEHAQLLTRHGLGRRIAVCSGGVAGIGRGHGRGDARSGHAVISLCLASCLLCQSSISYSPQHRHPLPCPGCRARCGRLWWSASSTVNSVNSHVHSLLFSTPRERNLGKSGC